MNDKKYIIAGLVIFIALFTFPFWYNSGKAAPAPEIKLTEKAKAAKECVMPTAYMRAEHMQLLDVWRDSVVRDGNRLYVADSGKSYNMSLQNECMRCHSSKVQFCDQCHNYMAVTPYYWTCHIEPKENK